MFSLSPKTYFVETFKLLIEAKTKVASVFAFDNCLFGNNCLAFYFTTGSTCKFYLLPALLSRI